MKLTILDRPASKKNSRRNFGHISLPSEAYMRFEESAIIQLIPYRTKHSMILTPVRVDYIFYQKGKMSQDSDNAMASINDVLEKAGIIQNDKLIRKGSFELIGGCADWKTELEITKAYE